MLYSYVMYEKGVFYKKNRWLSILSILILWFSYPASTTCIASTPPEQFVSKLNIVFGSELNLVAHHFVSQLNLGAHQFVGTDDRPETILLTPEQLETEVAELTPLFADAGDNSANRPQAGWWEQPVRRYPLVYKSGLMTRYSLRKTWPLQHRGNHTHPPRGLVITNKYKKTKNKINQKNDT